jgi:tRNA (guanine-N7-)-methyltransferase
MGRVLKDYECIAIKPGDLTGPIDFSGIFGRSGPVHIEIGSGKGTWVLSQAQAYPEINYFCIEWAGKYYRFAVDRLGRWGLQNVRIIRTDAAQLLADFIPDESVDCYHIYFPDPWPKKRHNKRRLLGQHNLENMLRSLKTGGIIQVATDYAEYFEQIVELLKANCERLETVEFIPSAGAHQGELVGTNYERKYIKENRPVFAVAVKKKPVTMTELE